MKCVTIGTVQSNQKVADQMFLATIEVPEIARQCLPGQFVNIYFPDSVKLFPRPFSIAGVSGKSILILYKVIGSQTTLMSRWQIGHQVKLLGPLGNSFSISEEKSIKYVLLAGGVGAAPLMFFRDELVKKNIKPYFFIGAKTKSELPIIKDGKSDLILTTDDGSKGLKGTVIEHFEDFLKNIRLSVSLNVCGPDPMMSTLKNISFPDNVTINVSLEKTMACGLGLCQGCVVKTTSGKNNGHYALVCKDGPVFNLNDVEFDE